MNAMNNSHHKFSSSNTILYLCTLLGMFLALAISIPPKAKLTSLPPLPATASILGITTPAFFQADIWIQTADGEIYNMSRGGEQYNLSIDAPTEEQMENYQCRPYFLSQIEATAGKVANCQTIQTFGEWCPGAVVSYALTKENTLWILEKRQPCALSFVISFIALGISGFIFGLLINVGRGIYFRRNFNR